MTEADSQETVEQALHRISNALEALVGITASLLELQIQSLEMNIPEEQESDARVSASDQIKKLLEEQKAALRKAQGKRD